MSFTVLAPIGQDEAVIEPQPLVVVTPEVAAAMQQFWNRTRTECERVLSPAQCASLFGHRSTVLPPGPATDAPFGVAWWGWLIVGVIIGKIVL